MKNCIYEKKMPKIDVSPQRKGQKGQVVRCGCTGYTEIKGISCCMDCPMFRPSMMAWIRGWWRWAKRKWKENKQ